MHHRTDQTVPQHSPAQQRQTRHALTALAHTTPSRRLAIQSAAEDYLSQIDRHRLPIGWNTPITDDHYNRVDAYRLRRGDTFAQMLGISCRASDDRLPDTARAVLAQIDAPVQQLTAAATISGQPLLVAVLHVAMPRPAAA